MTPAGPANPRRTPRRSPVLSLALGAVVAALAACRPASNAFAPPPPPEVTVAAPVRQPVTRYLEYTGTTEAFETVELRARVAGFLDQIAFKPGAMVRKGDLLFLIDPRVYTAQARQAEAEVAARNAALRLAQLTLDRTTQAVRSSAATQQEIDRATAERDQAKAQVELAEAALATAKLNVEFTQVRAPIDGRITRNLVDVGSLVGSPGKPTVLATIVSDRPLYVTVDASESDLLSVRRARIASAPLSEPGQVAAGEWRPVDMATADADRFSIRGRIDYVDPALNAETGTIAVRCRFENEDGILLPGLFVRLRIHLDTREELLAPDIALLSDQSGRYALVVNDKDTVEMRRVKVGALDGNRRVVTEGLVPTDRVVVNGLQRARPGAVVRPLSPAPGATGPGGRAPGGLPRV